jgi:hypothetical protein
MRTFILICLTLIFTGALASAKDAPPLSVKQFLKEEKFQNAESYGASLYLGPARPYEKFRIKGVVNQVSHCQACPPGVMCGPCSEFVVIADAKDACQEKAQRCDNAIQIFLDSANNYRDLVPGTDMVFEVEKSYAAYTISNITPTDREKSAKYQRIMKETLDSQPGLERAEHPNWLKDVPGETYRFKKQ